MGARAAVSRSGLPARAAAFCRGAVAVAWPYADRGPQGRQERHAGVHDWKNNRLFGSRRPRHLTACAYHLFFACFEDRWGQGALFSAPLSPRLLAAWGCCGQGEGGLTTDESTKRFAAWQANFPYMYRLAEKVVQRELRAIVKAAELAKKSPKKAKPLTEAQKAFVRR